MITKNWASVPCLREHLSIKGGAAIADAAIASLALAADLVSDHVRRCDRGADAVQIPRKEIAARADEPSMPPRKLAAHRSRPPGWVILLLVVIGLALLLVGAMYPCTSEAGRYACCTVGGILLVAAGGWAFGGRAIRDAVKALRS